ncbi:cation:proton antiporter [Salinigranum rubrum]|uniref:Cation:proton antiporter n=1 Tax=Salinigranum rubrum TaxID=755307 RepID=A0A2I8VEE2_9EURY|nr:proton-conducting transporter membrane subunit [Salinigranum rubrum]AUV80303.1 cation:proton antiporter [Salinigranum rubrum]
MTDVLTLPLWVAFVVAAVAAATLPRRPGHALAVALTLVTVPWAFALPAGTVLSVAPLGFEQVLLRVDGLTRPVAALFGFVAAANVLYGYATGADGRQTAYALCYMGAGVAAVVAGDWLTLLVAWELLAVASTVLVWHHGGEAVRVAFRYAVYHLLGGAFLVAGVALQFTATGTFLYGDGFTPGLPTALALVGVSVNLGVVGLHAWLSETYPVPHVAASVVLAGFTTKVAVYVLARVVPDGSVVVAWLGAVMILYGVTQAVLQTDLRRLLSYHIVSQVGYMVVAVGIGTAAGLTGAFAHLTAHVLYKGLLFMVAGAIVIRTGEESLKRLGGLARRMPLTFATFLVAALAIAGFPGFSGFVSKGLVTKAVESAGTGVALGPLGGDLLWWALVAGSVGTVLSFAKFGYYAFVRAAPARVPVARAPRTLSVSLVVVAVPCVLFGVFPTAFLGLFAGDPGSFEPYAASELTKALAATAVGVVGFVVLRGPIARLPAVDVDRVLHPAAARVATATAASFVRVGDAASARGAALSAHLGSLAGRDERVDTSLHAALWALALTTALALLAAALA